ncbi:MAG: NYN domain-containing protein [Archangium sp.]|nr:NYN domain-containing protein [Archangium sp.]
MDGEGRACHAPSVPDTKERRIALFIDFENLVTNTGITPASFDLQPPLDRLLEKGKVIFRRAYCNWSRFGDAKGNLHEWGVELVDVPPSTRAGKNGADMRLVIDALELCYAREHIDTFVIASGDSDFCPLAYKLRENDRYVIGLAVKDSTSPFFVKACDEFIYLKQPEGSGRNREERSHAPSSSRRGGSGRSEREPRSGGGGGGGKRGEMPAIAREIVANLLARATGPVNPSFLKEAIVRKQPDFDERDHGFSTFSRLLEALEKEGLLTRQQQGRQWYVLPAEGAAAESKPTPPESHDEVHEAHEEDEVVDEEPIPDPE